VPIVIPPSYFKVLSNLYLQEVWNAAEKVLCNSDMWVFCGYSFPDADMHFKYLLKRVQVNSSRPRKVPVFNWYDLKNPDEAANEQLRLRRFFGSKFDVDYKKNSFQELVRDPLTLLLR
jgi:hypothetical protein